MADCTADRAARRDVRRRYRASVAVDVAIAPRGWGGAVAPENRARRVGRREQVDAFDAFDKPDEFRDIRAVWEM
ncbi:hypothetical protein BURPS305_2571 [Burkholderia pseudomallei 305]|nr:hypothetical protein BURPS305_2571 [Burkholderia pseudomallei 305]